MPEKNVHHHAVSCKAALFSPNGKQVLLMQLHYADRTGYDLPGGFAKAGESPDKAVRRKIEEETGLKEVSLVRQDFWQHEDGKIVLGFAGQLKSTELPPAPMSDRQTPHWIDLGAIVRDEVNAGSYKEFILHTASQTAAHPVSCKVAIFTPDASKVLLMYYPQRKYHGLPGGHLEKGETPEEALKRELSEELGADILGDLTKRDFWVHPSGKVILGFVATATTEKLPEPPDREFEIGEWVTRDELKDKGDNYRQFILANWPDQQDKVQ